MSDRTDLIESVAKDLQFAFDADGDKIANMALAMVERFAPEPELPPFMVGHELVNVENINEPGYPEDRDHIPTENLDEANVISSKVKGTTRHKVIIDLDFDAALLPSSTPGHHHLYLDKELTAPQMEQLIYCLYEVGIIAQGNINQWHRFKALFLRLPWIKKTDLEVDDTPKD